MCGRKRPFRGRNAPEEVSSFPSPVVLVHCPCAFWSAFPFPLPYWLGVDTSFPAFWGRGKRLEALSRCSWDPKRSWTDGTTGNGGESMGLETYLFFSPNERAAPPPGEAPPPTPEGAPGGPQARKSPTVRDRWCRMRPSALSGSRARRASTMARCSPTLGFRSEARKDWTKTM